jgi:hypothetical protein
MVDSPGAIPTTSRPRRNGYLEAIVAGKEKYVGVPATIAFEKTVDVFESESRKGVTGREYPRKPT